MRVALDEQIFALQAFGGISRMFAELAAEFLSDPAHGVDLLPLHAPIINHYILADDTLRSRLEAHRARNEWTALLRYFSRLSVKTDADVVHSTFYLPHGLAPLRGAARVVTIHDMIPELLPRTRRRLDFLTLKKRYVEMADHVICVSEATRDDLLSVYGPVRAHVSVIHHGVDARFHPGAARQEFLPDRFLLFVGNRGQYKDAAVLLRALSLLGDRDLWALFIGGGAFTPDEEALIGELGLGDRCIQMTLSDDQMVSAFCHAEAFVFPSRFEGFGLPALEAMACGTPTVLAQATSLPEVGADAACYFTPGDHEALAGLLRDLLRDDQARRELAARGLARASAFTWARTAELTAEVYRTPRPGGRS